MTFLKYLLLIIVLFVNCFYGFKKILYFKFSNAFREKTIVNKIKCSNNEVTSKVQPDILNNITCCDDNSTNNGTFDETFILDITSADVDINEISDSNIVKIVLLTTSDQQSNQLVWKCLGYRYDPVSKKYSNEKVFPKWKLKYPEPPDLIGITRIYEPSIDKNVRDASMNLMRSIPRDFKGGVRNLVDVGFQGFSLKDLTPNKTRRAQLVNWLIYYREKLHGKTFEELQQEKLKEKAVLEEIAKLPSEQLFQKLRLDDQ